MDTGGRFIFMANRKVMITSIHKIFFKGRTVSRTVNFPVWSRILNGMSTEDFDSIYKFTVVRNPWDRVVSAFHYLQVYNFFSGMTFRDFVITALLRKGAGIDRHFHHQHKSVFFYKKMMVDDILKFENIIHDWRKAAFLIGCEGTLPHENRSCHQNYVECYDTETKSAVMNVYKKDIELFGYRFGE